MILHCQRDGLLTACQLVSAAVATRTTTPILSNIKAIGERDRLTLVGTDREVGIRYELAGIRVEEAGEAILPVGKLLSILRESPDQELTIDADERRCRVNTASSEFEMPSEDPAGFPDVPTFTEPKFHELTAGVLRTMIRRTIFAAAKQDTKFVITGILWEVEEKKVRLVATDTRRLAVATGAAVLMGGEEIKAHSRPVPTKAMSLLERTLHDDAELVKVCLRTNDVLFQTERATICTRLLEGRFPPYRDIIKKGSIKITVPVEAFLGAVRQAAIMTDEDSKKVLFHFGPGKLTLHAQGATTGKSKVDMQLDYNGPVVEIGFDPVYLVDMLKVLDSSEELIVEMVDGQKPALFRSGEDYLYLAMPLT